jgi:hypothetical protein
MAAMPGGQTARPPVAGLTAERRATLRRLADHLVPAYEKMPAASEVGVHEQLIEEVFKHRPDLKDNVLAALDRAQGREPAEVVSDLARHHAGEMEALGLAVSGAYYMSPLVRERLGYPGQENAPYDPYETHSYLLDGMIERVLARGRVYRPTPR